MITAAAAGRTSFGCVHENEWTYFGEAYFRHALRRSNSFVEAFAWVTQIVGRRELEEGKKPSNPQISLGKEIKVLLIKHKL